MTEYVLYPDESPAIMQCLVYISDYTHTHTHKMRENEWKTKNVLHPQLVGRNFQAILIFFKWKSSIRVMHFVLFVVEKVRLCVRQNTVTKWDIRKAKVPVHTQVHLCLQWEGEPR